MRWNNTNATVVLAPVNSTGDVGPSRPATFPFSASGLMRIELFTDQMPAPFDTKSGVLYLLDAAGHRLAEARFAK